MKPNVKVKGTLTAEKKIHKDILKLIEEAVYSILCVYWNEEHPNGYKSGINQALEDG